MTSILCFDCKQLRAEVLASHWGDGQIRCADCSDKRSAKFARERAEKRARATCEDCGVKTGGPDVCEGCCEHGDMDEGICLECGMDRREDLMAAAYYRAKDFRKYG